MYRDERIAAAAAEAQVIQTLRSLDIGPAHIERYGVHPDQFIEWYGEEGGQLVVFIHGGYFYEDGTLEYLRPAAFALGDAGYRVALVEYRREDGNPAASFEDMAVLARAPKLQGAIWVGHSAGAVFALHVLFREDLPVKHAVVLSPIFDLARAAEEDAVTLDVNPTARWLQGMPADIPDEYGRFEPLGIYSQLTAAGFRQHELRLDVIHGALDQTVPVARTRELMHEPFNIAIVPRETHNDPIRPGSDSWLLLLGSLG